MTDKDALELKENYRIPSLSLKNVLIRNFYDDYNSLIYVEKDNYIIQDIHVLKIQREKVIHHYGNYLMDANISISDTKIVDCSFSQGMLFVPPLNFLNPEE